MNYGASPEDRHIVAFDLTFVPHMPGRGALRMRDRGWAEGLVHSLRHRMTIAARAAFRRPYLA